MSWDSDRTPTPGEQEDPRDHLARARAELDQAMMVAPSLARAYYTLHKAFREAGFSRQEALQLVVEQMRSAAQAPPQDPQ